jgi:hypothetical protein
MAKPTSQSLIADLESIPPVACPCGQRGEPGAERRRPKA